MFDGFFECRPLRTFNRFVDAYRGTPCDLIVDARQKLFADAKCEAAILGLDPCVLRPRCGFLLLRFLNYDAHETAFSLRPGSRFTGSVLSNSPASNAAAAALAASSMVLCRRAIASLASRCACLNCAPALRIAGSS